MALMLKNPTSFSHCSVLLNSVQYCFHWTVDRQNNVSSTVSTEQRWFLVFLTTLHVSSTTSMLLPQLPDYRADNAGTPALDNQSTHQRLWSRTSFFMHFQPDNAGDFVQDLHGIDSTPDCLRIGQNLLFPDSPRFCKCQWLIYERRNHSRNSSSITRINSF